MHSYDMVESQFYHLGYISMVEHCIYSQKMCKSVCSSIKYYIFHSLWCESVCEENDPTISHCMCFITILIVSVSANNNSRTNVKLPCLLQSWLCAFDHLRDTVSIICYNLPTPL